MKTPRIEDFDPEAAQRQLNTPLDGMPAIEKPRPQPEARVVAPTNTSNGQKKKAVPIKAKRDYAPRTFNIFADQIEYLNKAWLEHKVAGRDVSINDMVREAIDLYITQKLSKK